MKRTGNLFSKITARDNLRLAVYRALRGKRERRDAREFVADLEANLRRMAAGLQSGSFPLGRCIQFTIHDPKERLITAPCFAERVLHHAIMNVCEPEFERFLIDQTYACRRGKGRIAALQRAKRYSRQYPVMLKFDVRKCFDSIPHEHLLERLQRRFKDRSLLELFERIIDAHETSPGHGLPIGSLMSQHLANFYLVGPIVGSPLTWSCNSSHRNRLQRSAVSRSSLDDSPQITQSSMYRTYEGE
jgi:retron-type reverse transcriptase